MVGRRISSCGLGCSFSGRLIRPRNLRIVIILARRKNRQNSIPAMIKMVTVLPNKPNPILSPLLRSADDLTAGLDAAEERGVCDRLELLVDAGGESAESVVLVGRLVRTLLIDRDATELLGEEAKLLVIGAGSVVAVFAGKENGLVAIETNADELCVLTGAVEAAVTIIVVVTIAMLVTVVDGETVVGAAAEESTGVIPSVVR